MATGRIAAVVLAAGAGTRMHSDRPKPLHEVAGRPMLDHVVWAVRAAGADEVALVLSPSLAADPAVASRFPDVVVAVQTEPRGTGDALAVALPDVGDAETVVVVFADHPLLLPSSLHALLDAAETPGVCCALLTCRLPDGAGYGRIVRDEAGRVIGIVERKDDDPALRLGSMEANSGMMAVRASWLREALGRVEPSPVTGELYLTELPRLAVEAHDGEEWPVVTVEGHPDELVGINDRADLARADGLLRARIRAKHLEAGVTMVQPESILIDIDVEIGRDTTLLPGTHLLGGTVVGEGCTVGPYAVVRDSTVGAGCEVVSSYVVEAWIGDHVHIGPFSHIRSGTRIEHDVHVGNFAEIKNSRIAPGVRVGHVGYLGDASIGERTNIGAGTITCNFDGREKHPTRIGRDVLVGSDTMLVAPVTLGDGSATGAGAVVTEDVPAGETVVGVPARVLRRRRERGEGNDGS